MLNITHSGVVVAPTDFYIEIESILDRDDNAIDLATMPFYFEFFGVETYAKIQSGKAVTPQEIYIVSFDGADRVNNVFEDGVLRFVFEGYPFGATKLCYKQLENYGNDDFSDDSEDIVTILKTGVSIKLVGSNTMASSNNIAGNITTSALKGADGVISDEQLVDVVKQVETGLDLSQYAKSEDVPSIEGLATETFVTESIQEIPTPDVSEQIAEHNASNVSHQDIRDSIPANVSQLSNDSLYTTLASVLERVYSKSETLTTDEVKVLIKVVQDELDTLVGGDASTTIDSYNEIIAFLSSFTDSEDLASVLLALKNEIVALIPSLEGYMTAAIANNTFVSLSGYVAYSTTEKTKLAGIAEGADVTPTLGAVATSNSYNDLDNKPTIPSISGLATETYVDNAISDLATEDYVTNAINSAINDSWEGEY